jgi:small subunit ribosomal protein S1
MVPESNDITTGDPPQTGDGPPAVAEAQATEQSGAADVPHNGLAPDAAPQQAAHQELAQVEGRPDEGAPTDDAAKSPAGDGVAKKKRRRRRRGKKGHGGEAAAGADASATATTDAGESGSETAPDEAAKATEPRNNRRGGDGQTGEEKGTRGKGAAKRGKGKKPRAPRADHGPPRERTAFHVGEEVFGKVTSVTEHAIMVDLSGKALAIFDRHELAEDDLVPEASDRFVAHVHGDGSRGGFVVLTRKPLREEETKPRVEEASKSGGTVLGLVTGVVKGGIEVDVDGLRAFAPGSHVDLRPGADLAHLVGQRLEFTVAQYAKRGRDVVVSRKGFIEAEAKEFRKAALAKLEIGSVVKGIVRSVVQYGAFIAIPSADDVEGLVHMTEASHDRGAKLSDVFHVGAEIDVKVLRVDDKGKLWLSHKEATVDPWQEAMKTYAQGTRHKGKVVRLLPFGAFVELAPGVEGLLHTSDLSYKRIEHPKDVLKENEEIDVVVADVERGSHKIALHPAPPAGEENEPRQKVVPHKAVKIAVVAAESSGLVVRVIGLTGRQSRGFIPAGHTGTERGTDLRKHFPPGTRLDAKVIEIDPRRGEAKLSLRAFKEDTEKAAYNEYRASVAKASKFGTLGDLLANAAKKR